MGIEMAIIVGYETVIADVVRFSRSEDFEYTWIKAENSDYTIEITLHRKEEEA